MKYLLILALICTSALVTLAQLPAKEPKKIGTTADFRDLLLTNKWSWRNVSAGVPDRECVFMPDGTFRHPNFTAGATGQTLQNATLGGAMIAWVAGHSHENEITPFKNPNGEGYVLTCAPEIETNASAGPPAAGMLVAFIRILRMRRMRSAFGPGGLIGMFNQESELNESYRP